MGTRIARQAFLPLPLLLAGCGYQAHNPSPGVTEFHFSTGTYVGMVIIPLVLAAVAVVALLRRGDAVLKVFAAGGLGLLLLVCVTILPGVWRDVVTVDSQGIRQSTGFWWSPKINQIPFAQAKEVRIVRKPSGPENRLSTVWEVVRKDGSTYDIDPGDLWDHVEDELVKLSGEHGVPVRDMR
jgi:hypothetical protein